MKKNNVIFEMNKTTQTYLLIADSHLEDGAKLQEFQTLLEKISCLPLSCGVVFLGDIYELWVALDRYENERHRTFLTWCSGEIKAGREIIFTEGNHEFYLDPCRRKFFTEVTRRDIRRGNVVFTHGDTLNLRDYLYLLMRMGIRNFFTRFLLYLVGPSFGPNLTQRIRLRLKTANMVHKKHFPVDDVKMYLKKLSVRGVRTVFAGHFHAENELNFCGVQMYVLPAFINTGEIGVYTVDPDKYELLPWETALEKLNNTGEKR